ncbi:MAG TPA: hypothetical protein VK558_05125 [Patescibacteria group bacterium]|nr:hypothetical protein [Patescibacteria group bacterium]
MLGTMPKPSAYTPARWLQIIQDAVRFRDTWGTETVRLDWDAASIFGVGRDAPESRYDLMGLVVVLRGWTVTEITATKIVTSNPTTGRTLSYFRKPAAAGQCLLWELKP